MVVVNSSTLDTALSDLLAQCLYLSTTQENALLRPLGTRAKIDTLQRLAKFALSPLPSVKTVTSWCERAKAKMNERNTVIHGAPGIHKGKITLRLYTGGKAFDGEMEEWPKERVSNLHEAIFELRKELQTEVAPLFDTWLRATRKYHREHFDGPRTPPE